MIKKLLRFVGIFGGILTVIWLGMAFVPLWLYMLVAICCGLTGGTTSGGRLEPQGIRVFYLIFALVLYVSVGWMAFDPTIDARFIGFPFIIPGEWIRWVGVVTLVLSFMLFGGLESGDEDPLTERGEEV